MSVGSVAIREHKAYISFWMRSLHVRHRKPSLVNQFPPVYLFPFPSFCPSVLVLPVAKTVLVTKWWQELSISLMKYLSLFDSVSLISWCERQSMITKACPSTQAIGISVQLLFAWPEETALQKHPWRKGKQAERWAGGDSNRLTTRIKQMLLLTIWLSHPNG